MSFIDRYSMRALARRLNCSECRIRQMLDLAKLSPDAQKDLCEGKIGVKRALKLARQLRMAERRRGIISADAVKRQESIERGACLISKWILVSFRETHAIQFLELVFGEENGPAGKVFARLRPQPHTIRLDADPVRLIQRWKPKYAPTIRSGADEFLYRMVGRLGPSSDARSRNPFSSCHIGEAAP
jgi:hypothetical protein